MGKPKMSVGRMREIAAAVVSHDTLKAAAVTLGYTHKDSLSGAISRNALLRSIVDAALVEVGRPRRVDGRVARRRASDLERAERRLRVQQRKQRAIAAREQAESWRERDGVWSRIVRHPVVGEVLQVRLIVQQRGEFFRCVVREGFSDTFGGYKGGLREAKMHLDESWAAILRRGK